MQPVWDSAGKLLKRKWGNTVNKKCSQFEMNKIRTEGSGGNWEQGLKSPQNCDKSHKRGFFSNVYLSVIFASTFSEMINSFLLSATEFFRTYRTRYLNFSLFTHLFIPPFTAVNSVKNHIITWRMGWTWGHTEPAECMEFSVLGLCVVADIPPKNLQTYSHM